MSVIGSTSKNLRLLLSFGMLVASGRPKAAEGEADAPEAPSPPPSVDCDQTFAPFADGRRVESLALYRALVANDIIAFLGSQADAPVAAQLQSLEDKGYQLDKLTRKLLGNKALVHDFRHCREVIAKVPLYYAPEDRQDEGASMVRFINGEFRFVLSGGGLPMDQVLAMAIWSHTPQDLDKADVTAARSHRAVCWKDDDSPIGDACGLRLRDMPHKLKDTIEDEFGKSVGVRWRWLGFGEDVTGRFIDVDGHGPYRAVRHVRAPAQLELQFIDTDGGVIWGAK